MKYKIDSAAALKKSNTDDPRVIKEQSVTEDYARHVVPLSGRTTRWNVAMANWAIVSALVYVYVSASIMQAVGSLNTIIGMILGVVIYAIINFFVARVSVKNGLTVALLSRSIFGAVGAILATLIMAVSAILFAVIEGSIIAVALQTYFAPQSDMWIWYLIVVASGIPLVIGGVQAWLGRLNGFLLPLYLIGLAVVVVATGMTHGFSTAFLTVSGSLDLTVPGWLWATGIYMGFGVNVMFAVDFGRFGKPSDAKFHGIISFGLIFYILTIFINGLVGMFLMERVFPETAATEQGAAEAILAVTGLFGLLLIIVSQTRINTANNYMASTNMEALMARAFGIQWPRLVWVGISGIIIFLLMLTDVLSHLNRVVSWLSVGALSWLAVVLVYLILHRKETDTLEFRPGRVKQIMPATWAMVIATISGLALIELGPAEAWYVEVAPFVAPTIAIVLSLLAYRFSSSNTISRLMDPRDEVEDVWATRIECHLCERSYTALEMDRDPSARQQAICAACADGNTRFLEGVRREAADLDQGKVTHSAID